jgi:hypothetical protein
VLALAEPGTVVVTAQVQRQIVGLFVAEERGSHQLKGVLQPVTLVRIVRASGGGRRARQRHLTPLIGREEEIAILLRRWERARQGRDLPTPGSPMISTNCRLIEEFHAGCGRSPISAGFVHPASFFYSTMRGISRRDHKRNNNTRTDVEALVKGMINV